MKRLLLVSILVLAWASSSYAQVTCTDYAKARLSQKLGVTGSVLEEKFSVGLELFTPGEILVHSLSFQALTPGSAQWVSASREFKLCWDEEGAPVRELYQERLLWAARQAKAEKLIETARNVASDVATERTQVSTPTQDTSEIDELRADIRQLQSQLALVQQQRVAAQQKYKELTGWKGFVTSMANGVNRQFAEQERRRRVESEYRAYMHQRAMEQQALQFTLDDISYTLRKLEDRPNCHDPLTLDIRCEQW